MQLNTKVLDAIAAFRDVAQHRQRLKAEQATLEERLAVIREDLARLDQQYVDAKKAALDAILEDV